MLFFEGFLLYLDLSTAYRAASLTLTVSVTEKTGNKEPKVLHEIPCSVELIITKLTGLDSPWLRSPSAAEYAFSRGY